MNTKTFVKNAQPAARLRKGLAAALAGLLPAAAACAGPSASGGAYGMKADVSVLAGLQALSVPPQAQLVMPAQTTAFSDAKTALPLNVASAAVAPLITLTTGTLDSLAEWAPPAASGGFLAAGTQGLVENVALNAVNLTADSLLSLNAQQVRATALISGYCPPAPPPVQTTSMVGDLVADAVYRNGFDLDNLLAGGDTSAPGLGAGVLGTSFGVLPANPAPNTGLCILGNTACLVLNEQVVGGDGITTRSLSVNGVHLTVNVPAVISADVVLAHADATVSCN